MISTASPAPQKLSGNLTTPTIVAMVISAAAPLGTVVAAVPLAFALGSGPATPLSFLLAGAILLLFAAGFTAMCRRFLGAGGYYVYITKGLGRAAGAAAGLVAVFTYNFWTGAMAGGMGYFATLVLTDFLGWNVPWIVPTVVSLLLVGLAGYRSIDVASKVLLILVAVEFGLLLILAGAIVVQRGLEAFPLEALSVNTLFTTGSAAVGLMLAFQSYIGFEQTAVYSEEARDPRRTIPRAVYASIAVIGLFYFFTIWVSVGAIGVENVVPRVNEESGEIFFNLSAEFVSPVLGSLILLMMITTTFACQMSFHNAASRYMFAMGREGLLPAWLGVAHPRFKTPARASIIQTSFAIVVSVLFAVAGLEPFLNLYSSMLGVGAVGSLTLLALVALAIVVYFVRNRVAGKLLATVIAPGVAGVLLAVLVAFVILNFELVTGTDSLLINGLPFILIAAALYGVGLALWLKANRPETYSRIGEFNAYEASGAEPSPAASAAAN